MIVDHVDEKTIIQSNTVYIYKYTKVEIAPCILYNL